MTLNRLLLLSIALSIKILNAQTDFRPGYIINKAGDTIYGQIDYRGDLLMSSVCKFKNADNIETDFYPRDIKGYRFVDSKFYITKEVNNKKVFLEFLIKGEVNIYYMRDDKGNHYYLDKEGEKLAEIPYEKEIIQVDNIEVLYESTKHFGFLNYYMQDAPDFQSRIQSVRKPDHFDLIRLAEDYHNLVCIDEKCIIYEKKVPLIKVSIKPFIGFTKYDGYHKLVNEYGAYFFIWAPRTSEKLFIKTGVAYNKISDEVYDLDIYRIPIQFQYIFKAYRLQPHVSAGFFLNSIKKDLFGTLGMSAGLNYEFFNNISLSTSLSSDFTPISNLMLDKYVNFDLITYSFIVGLRIDI